MEKQRQKSPAEYESESWIRIRNGRCRKRESRSNKCAPSFVEEREERAHTHERMQSKYVGVSFGKAFVRAQRVQEKEVYAFGWVLLSTHHKRKSSKVSVSVSQGLQCNKSIPDKRTKKGNAENYALLFFLLLA